MADELLEPNLNSPVNQARRLGISHLGIAGGVVAAMLTIQPVKDFLYTREEGTAVENRVTRVEQTLTNLTEVVRTGQEKNLERVTDALRDQDLRMDSKLNNLETSLNRNIELLLRRETINTNKRER